MLMDNGPALGGAPHPQPLHAVDGLAHPPGALASLMQRRLPIPKPWAKTNASIGPSKRTYSTSAPFAIWPTANSTLTAGASTIISSGPTTPLALAVPATRYTPSPRPFPERLPPLDYGGRGTGPPRSMERRDLVSRAALPPHQGLTGIPGGRAAHPPRMVGGGSIFVTSISANWICISPRTKPQCVNHVPRTPVNDVPGLYRGVIGAGARPLLDSTSVQG